MSESKIRRVYKVSFEGTPSPYEVMREMSTATKVMDQYGPVDISVDCDSTIDANREISFTMKSED